MESNDHTGSLSTPHVDNNHFVLCVQGLTPDLFPRPLRSSNDQSRLTMFSDGRPLLEGAWNITCDKNKNNLPYRHQGFIIYDLKKSVFKRPLIQNICASSLFALYLLMWTYVPGVSKQYGVENYNILRIVQYINVIFWDLVTSPVHGLYKIRAQSVSRAPTFF